VAYDGVTPVISFVKISQLVQMLKW